MPESYRGGALPARHQRDGTLGPASDLAVALVNRIVLGRIRPPALARLDLRDGVPAELRTLVAIPTLLATAADVEDQVRRLEIHYLANPDGDVRFALLSDWPDAATESAASDDELLAAATAGIAHLYLEVTGDDAILDEGVPFIEGPDLSPGQADAYFLPETSGESASLYEHCARAIDASLGLGAHGLPLMGSGDWNDGMNLVGAGGRGESTWLGWFLLAVIGRFGPVAESRGDRRRARRWQAHAKALAVSMEEHGWDGDWYRRGFFDDGTPLGSAASVECRIDAIAQSWSVLSGAGDPERSRRAMASVSEHLVRRGDGLVLLFTPPFDRSDVDPGYIKGYLPGIRENGGQYTHGAIWSLLAFAGLGDGDTAGDLFSILNPINHASTRSGVQRYKVEPYVMAADVYAAPGHVGRGGWTWYTGSSGWMYQAGLEAILGLQVRGAALRVSPTIPRAWPGFEIGVRHGASRYEIAVENPHGVSEGIASASLDGVALDGPAPTIELRDDGETHRVRVVLGEAPSPLPA